MEDRELREEIDDLFYLYKQAKNDEVRNDAVTRMVKLITDRETRLLEQLKTELRDYREEYSDADFNDVLGYIAGFQHRPTNLKQEKKT